MNSHLQDGTRVAPELSHSHDPPPGFPLSLLRENHLCPSLLKKTPKQSQIFYTQENQHFLCALQYGFLMSESQHFAGNCSKGKLGSKFAFLEKKTLVLENYICSFGKKKSLKNNLSSCNN